MEVSRAEYVAAVHAVRACMRAASLTVSPLRLSIVDGTILEYDVEIGDRDDHEVEQESTACEDRYGADVIAAYSRQTLALRHDRARRRLMACGIEAEQRPTSPQIECLRASTPRVAEAENDGP